MSQISKLCLRYIFQSKVLATLAILATLAPSFFRLYMFLLLPLLFPLKKKGLFSSKNS